MRSIESDSYDRLVQWLQAFEFSKGEVIIIDGESGAGKSSLAMRLAKDFGAVRINLDSYVSPGAGGYYVDAIKHEYLQNDINRFIHLFSAVIIEGICVRDALKRYGVTWDAAIYVKKISTNGLWHFLHHLDDFISGRKTPVKIIEPHLSDYSYHARFRPHEKADFIYLRISD